MLFHYIRHGDPIYNPDSLTPLGQRQAEAVGKRLALHGVDKVFSSTSNRAFLTGKPTCELLRLDEPVQLAFAEEGLAWRRTATFNEDGVNTWAFYSRKHIDLFTTPAVYELGHRWYEHPELTEFKEGFEAMYDDVDDFFRSLGYEHERYTGRYKIVTPNKERVALFAHQGFGIAFLSCVLDIPYPTFCTRFDICHTGVTTIDFQEHGEYAVPKVLVHSSDAHLYKEGLPTKYNYGHRF